MDMSSAVRTQPEQPPGIVIDEVGGWVSIAIAAAVWPAIPRVRATRSTSARKRRNREWSMRVHIAGAGPASKSAGGSVRKLTVVPSFPGLARFLDQERRQGQGAAVHNPVIAIPDIPIRKRPDPWHIAGPGIQRSALPNRFLARRRLVAFVAAVSLGMLRLMPLPASAASAAATGGAASSVGNQGYHVEDTTMSLP